MPHGGGSSRRPQPTRPSATRPRVQAPSLNAIDRLGRNAAQNQASRNRGTVDALAKVYRTAARHEATADPLAMPVDPDRDWALDPVHVSDQQIRDALNLSDNIPVDKLRTNPQLLDAIPFANERLAEVAKQSFYRQNEEDDKKEESWYTPTKDWLMDNIVKPGGFTLGQVAKGIEFVEYGTRRELNQMIDDVEKGDVEGAKYILGKVVAAAAHYDIPYVGMRVLGASPEIAEAVGTAVAPKLEGEEGPRFFTNKRYHAAAAEALSTTGEAKEQEGYKQRRDAYLESGMPKADARIAAFDERQDVSGPVKIGLPFVSDPAFWAELPFLGGAIKGAAVGGGKALRGLARGGDPDSMFRTPKFLGGIRGEAPSGGAARPYGRTDKNPVNDLPDNDNILETHLNPSRKSRVTAHIPGMGRIFGAPAKIGAYEVGSPERIVMEAKVLHGALTDKGEDFTSLMSQVWRGRGALVTPKREAKLRLRRGLKPWERKADDALFEIDPETQILESGKVWRKFDKAKAPVTWGDVFENPTKFTGLTRQQSNMIEDVRVWYKDMLKMATREGVPIEYLGSLEDGFSYVGRRVKGFRIEGQVVELAEITSKTGGPRRAKGFAQSRLYESMSDGVKVGTMYSDPFETMAEYSRTMYREIARRRTEKRLSPLLRSKKADDIEKFWPDLFNARDAAKGVWAKQKKYLTLLTHYAKDEIPHGSSISAMKRAFPELESEIDEAMSYTGNQWKAAIESFKVHYPELHQNKAARRALEAIGSKHRDTPSKIAPKVLHRKEVYKALQEIGIGDIQARAMANKAMKALGKEARLTRNAALNRLAERMDEFIPGSKQAYEELQQQTSRLVERYQSPQYGEAVAQRAFPEKIFTGDRAEWAALQMEEFIAPARSWVRSTTVNLSGLIRQMKTVADFGAPLVHGLPILFKNPEQWGQATRMHLRAFADNGVKARYMADNAEDIAEFIKYGLHIGSTEMTEASLRGGWLAKLPIYGEKLGRAYTFGADNTPAAIARSVVTGPARGINIAADRFSSSFESFLDISRIEIMKGLAATARRAEQVKPGAQGKLTTHQKMAEAADYANKITGHISSRALGIPTRQRDFESAMLLFSPRYTRAIASIFTDMTSGGLKGSEARSALSHLFMGQIAFHAAVSISLGQEMNLVPGAYFLKNRIAADEKSPGVWVGMGGKPNSIASMLGDVTKQLISNPAGFITVNTFSAQTYDENSVLKRLRYQLAPPFQEILNITTGADPIGRELPDWSDPFSNWQEITKYIGTRFTPFALEAAIEAGGVLPRGLGFVSESAGGMTTPAAAYVMRNDLRDKYAKEDYGVKGKVNAYGYESYDDLKKNNLFRYLAKNLEANHPDLQEWTKKAEVEQSKFVRNNERIEVKSQEEDIEREAINGVMNEDETQIIVQGWNQHGEMFPRGPRPGKSLRDGFWDVNDRRQAAKRQLRKDHPRFYEERDDYYAETDPENKAAEVTSDFIDFYTSPAARDQFGNLNHGAIAAFKKGLRDTIVRAEIKLGKSDAEANEAADKLVSDMNQNYLMRYTHTPDGTKIHPVILEYIASWDVLDPYHAVYKKILPEDDWVKWQVFSNAPWEIKQAMLGEYEYERMEERVKDAQVRMRETDLEIDRLLVKFYDMAPVHRTLIREIEKRQREY